MIGKDIIKAAELLQKGHVVGIPTETVYGLAANALNQDAVLSIYDIKNRPQFDPLIIHLPNFEAIEKYTLDIPEKAYLLSKNLMPGPLTLLLFKKDIVPYIVTSGSNKVAVRIPQHYLTLELLNHLDFPLAAPSANPFGYISPTKAEHVEKQLGDKIPYILDGGDSEIGIESTIVDCTTTPFTILRLVGISQEALENCLGEKLHLNIATNSNPEAPGQLDKHYSPTTPLLLLDKVED
ncbi:MAG: L-threonylcarbamoyladenylate synthase, partial [Candidatus Paceibacterota bacterium]